MRKFYIVGQDSSVHDVWRNYGCERVGTLEEADIVIFRGGTDISHEIYHEKSHRNMYSINPRRDTEEIDAYYRAINLEKYIFGICRGGQLAHALNGGKLWQHVNNHIGAPHEIRDKQTGKVHVVSSCHHQMMKVDNQPRQNEPFEIVATASESTIRETWDMKVTSKDDATFGDDIEVLWYPRVKTLCYQSHPEFGVRTDSAYAFELQKHFGFLPPDSTPVDLPNKPDPYSGYADFWLDQRIWDRMTNVHV